MSADPSPTTSDDVVCQAISSARSVESLDEILIDSGPRKTNIFTLYAKIFRLLLTAQIPNFSLLSDELRNRELEKLILPSDEDWRHRVYHSLVELQRDRDAEIAEDRRMKDSKRRTTRQNSQDWEWRPREKGYLPKGRRGENQNIVGSSIAISGIGSSITEARVEPGWRINDILLAAKVLQDTRPSPNYANEAEMRRVFGLVYDVLRYKNILNRTLKDGGFWYRNDALKQRERVVWLLLYDMQGRKFARRHDGNVIETREKIFETAGLKDIEDALLKAKTHLAASISRLRIGGSALNLDELLPTHLCIMEGINWTDKGAIASGWINTMQVLSKNEFVKDMSKLKLELCDTEVTELYENKYIFDPICPKMINLHDRMREKLAMSDLVRDHRFIFLSKKKTLSKDTSGKISKVIATDTYRQEQSREHWEEQSQTRQEQTKFPCKREDEEDEKFDTMGVIIPDSDLFEVGTIDEIYGEKNEHTLDPGCFIAVIKRKEMMQFDSLFMIKVAESKGLFGDADKERDRKEKVEILPAVARQTSRISRRVSKRVKVETDRVAAPTHASMLRATNKRQLCPRHGRRIVRDEKLFSTRLRETRKRDARRWWRDVIAFLIDSENQCRDTRHRQESALQFYATRSDPFTQKPLYPSRATKVALSSCPTVLLHGRISNSRLQLSNST